MAKQGRLKAGLKTRHFLFRALSRFSRAAPLLRAGLGLESEIHKSFGVPLVAGRFPAH